MFLSSMTFDLGDDVNALRDMVHTWAQDRVKPMAAAIGGQFAASPRRRHELLLRRRNGCLSVTVR